jgi:hypothetical protein
MGERDAFLGKKDVRPEMRDAVAGHQRIATVCPLLTFGLPLGA